MEKIFNKRNTFIVVGIIILYKIFLSCVLELHPDEAYYWLWAQHLSFGYYDHSPMIAYFIKLTTLFSDSEVFVRFSSIIVTVILSFLMWNFTKKLFGDERVASAAVIIVNTLPLMLIGSVIITPDTPVFLFFAFTVYFLWRLIETDRTKYWYLTGLFLGLTLLSKYTGVLFGLSLFVYMVLDKKTDWLKNKHFYLMFLLAFILFLPVIIWNWQQDWISFTYQLDHGLSSSRLRPGQIFEYIGAQSLVAGPVIFAAGIFAAIAYFRSKDTKKIFLASFSIPIIGIFVFTAIKKNPGANWPAFAYFAFSIMAAQYLFENMTSFKRKVLVTGISLNLVLSALVGLHAAYGIVPIYKFSQKDAVADATNWFTGWRSLGESLKGRDIKYIVTHSHQWGGALAYYARGTAEVFLDNVPKNRYNQFMYWGAPDDTETSNVTLVRIDNRMEDDFSSIEGAEVFFVTKNGLPIRQYAVIEKQGYKIQTNPH